MGKQNQKQAEQPNIVRTYNLFVLAKAVENNEKVRVEKLAEWEKKYNLAHVDLG